MNRFVHFDLSNIRIGRCQFLLMLAGVRNKASMLGGTQETDAAVNSEEKIRKGSTVPTAMQKPPDGLFNGSVDSAVLCASSAAAAKTQPDSLHAHFGRSIAVKTTSQTSPSLVIGFI